ncbi:MAG: hypothetical protein OXI70_01650 [Chloroflexota bacterium]|nr:hypothetical protein [Chloroflexota bacterium]
MSFWHRLPRLRRSLLALVVSGAVLAAAAGVVWAHEGREVHGFTFDVGFLVEPAYEGQPNGVYLSVTRASVDHHGTGQAASGVHDHGGTVETSDMSVEVTAEVDPIDGINVQIIPTGFVFAPERVNQADVEGEGHAHVYVDGEKVGRVYGEWFHLKSVAPGDREIRVTLQTNGHSEYAVGGQTVQATTTLSVPAMPPAPEEVGQVEAPEGMGVAISLEPDPVGGANLVVMPQGFTLAPEHVNAPNVAGQGHPHVYVNGVRLGRVYSPYLHLGKLAPGMNEVRVTLNTNMHQEYSRDGETIEAVATIHIPAEGEVQTDDGHGARVGVTGLANSLVVEVTHLAADMSASGVARQMALSPLPGESGGYVAPFIPTVPGPYRFRFIGTIEGLPVDETFTSGPGTFDDVRSATEAQFPRPVPSAREIAGVATAAQLQARDASDASATALTVAVAGLVIGGLGLATGVGLALHAFRRRGAG